MFFLTHLRTSFGTSERNLQFQRGLTALYRSQRRGVKQQMGEGEEPKLPPLSKRLQYKRGIFILPPANFQPRITELPTTHDVSFPLILPGYQLKNRGRARCLSVREGEMAQVLQNTCEEPEAMSEVHEIMESMEGDS